MKDALVFGGTNSLDFIDVRLGVVRIPEVSLKLQEAQQIWDRHHDSYGDSSSFSFHSFLMAEDSVFFNNISLKSLCLSIVQLGLYDRYCRLFRAPSCYIGNIQNDSALSVVVGRQTLAQLITGSPAFCSGMQIRPIHIVPESSGLTLLNGQNLPQYQTFEKAKSKLEIPLDSDARDLLAVADMAFTPVHEPELKISRAIERAIDEKGISKLIHVGPGQLDRAVIETLEPRELQIVESIDVDPMLGWFWREIRTGGSQRAQA